MIWYWILSSALCFVLIVDMPGSRYSGLDHVVACLFVSLGLGWLAWPFALIGRFRADADH